MISNAIHAIRQSVHQHVSCGPRSVSIHLHCVTGELRTCAENTRSIGCDKARCHNFFHCILAVVATWHGISKHRLDATAARIVWLKHSNGGERSSTCSNNLRRSSFRPPQILQRRKESFIDAALVYAKIMQTTCALHQLFDVCHVN